MRVRSPAVGDSCAPERQHRAVRQHGELLEASERAGDVLGQSVREIILAGIAALVGEDSTATDRPVSTGAGAAATASSVGRRRGRRNRSRPPVPSSRTAAAAAAATAMRRRRRGRDGARRPIAKRRGNRACRRGWAGRCSSPSGCRGRGTAERACRAPARRPRPRARWRPARPTPCSRAARFTVSPNTSSSEAITSPRCSPIREGLPPSPRHTCVAFRHAALEFRQRTAHRLDGAARIRPSRHRPPSSRSGRRTVRPLAPPVRPDARAGRRGYGSSSARIMRL